MSINASIQSGWTLNNGEIPAKPSSCDELERLISMCRQEDATDLHLAPNLPPYIRVNGQLKAIHTYGNLCSNRIEACIRKVMGAADPHHLELSGSQDGAYTSSCGTRFRFNVLRHQGDLSLVMRRLEEQFRTLSQLGLPEHLYKLCNLHNGLVLAAGPTGAGKSTTLASLLDRINHTRNCHMVTIEDPIEYVHRPAKSLIRQRQIGADAISFNEALQASLRQDPDVILVGEIRDQSTIQTAITAAEAGHLVFSTVHASDTVGAVERLVSMFPAHEQVGMRSELSRVLRAVIAQYLFAVERPAAVHPKVLKRLKPQAHTTENSTTDPMRSDRVVACEIMLCNTAVANLIATGKTGQLYSVLESCESDGMQSFDRDMARLLVEQLISEQTAMNISKNPNVMKEHAELLRRRHIAGTQSRIRTR